MYVGVYFKGLATTIMEAGKPQICKVVRQVKDPFGKPDASVQVQRLFPGRITLLLRGSQSFALYRSSTYWLWPTRIL